VRWTVFLARDDACFIVCAVCLGLARELLSEGTFKAIIFERFAGCGFSGGCNFRFVVER